MPKAFACNDCGARMRIKLDAVPCGTCGGQLEVQESGEPVPASRKRRGLCPHCYRKACPWLHGNTCPCASGPLPPSSRHKLQIVLDLQDTLKRGKA